MTGTSIPIKHVKRGPIRLRRRQRTSANSFHPASCPHDRTGMIIRMIRVTGTHGLCITDLAPNGRQASPVPGRFPPHQAIWHSPSTRIPRKVRDRPRRSSPPAHVAHDTLRYLSTTPSDFDLRLLEKFAAPPLVGAVKINIDDGSGRIPLNRSAAPCGTVAGQPVV